MDERTLSRIGPATPKAWIAEYDGNIDTTIYADTAERWQKVFGRKVTPLYDTSDIASLAGALRPLEKSDHAQSPDLQFKPTEEMVLAGADVLMTACESPGGQLHPWKPFDMAQVAIKVWTAMVSASPDTSTDRAALDWATEEAAKIEEYKSKNPDWQSQTRPARDIITKGPVTSPVRTTDTIGDDK